MGYAVYILSIVFKCWGILNFKKNTLWSVIKVKLLRFGTGFV